MTSCPRPCLLLFALFAGCPASSPNDGNVGTGGGGETLPQGPDTGVDGQGVSPDAAAAPAPPALDGASGEPVGQDAAASSGCTPVSASEQVCDGVDDDCNGVVDDVDLGNDGFCDCYSIGIVGTPGSNPSSDFEAWLNATGTAVSRIGTDPGHRLTAGELEAFDILILDRLTRAYPEEDAAVLAAYLESGHGLITMAGYTNSTADWTNQNSLVRAAGVQLVEPIYLDPVEQWFAHPITDGAEAVQFRGGWPIEALDGGSLGEVLLRAEADSAVLGVALERGDGRAFVYGDEWISFDSEWRSIPGVTVLWQNAIRWVGPSTSCFPPIL